MLAVASKTDFCKVPALYDIVKTWYIEVASQVPKGLKTQHLRKRKKVSDMENLNRIIA